MPKAMHIYNNVVVEGVGSRVVCVTVRIKSITLNFLTHETPSDFIIHNQTGFMAFPINT